MNESEINTWLRAGLYKLDTRGVRSLGIAIYADDAHFAGVNGYDHAGKFHCERGATIAEAFAKLRANIAVNPAKSLRAEAAKLLREAAELEGAK